MQHKETDIFTIDDFTVRYFHSEDFTEIFFYRGQQKLLQFFVDGNRLEIAKTLHMKSSVLIMIDNPKSTDVTPEYKLNPKWIACQIY